MGKVRVNRMVNGVNIVGTLDEVCVRLAEAEARVEAAEGEAKNWAAKWLGQWERAEAAEATLAAVREWAEKYSDWRWDVGSRNAAFVVLAILDQARLPGDAPAKARAEAAGWVREKITEALVCLTEPYAGNGPKAAAEILKEALAILDGEGKK